MEIIREEKAGLSGKARCINFRISLQKDDMFPDGSLHYIRVSRHALPQGSGHKCHKASCFLGFFVHGGHIDLMGGNRVAVLILQVVILLLERLSPLLFVKAGKHFFCAHGSSFLRMRDRFV